jgi:hypothetical protein
VDFVACMGSDQAIRFSIALIGLASPATSFAGPLRDSIRRAHRCPGTLVAAFKYFFGHHIELSGTSLLPVTRHHQTPCRRFMTAVWHGDDQAAFNVHASDYRRSLLKSQFAGFSFVPCLPIPGKLVGHRHQWPDQE